MTFAELVGPPNSWIAHFTSCTGANCPPNFDAWKPSNEDSTFHLADGRIYWIFEAYDEVDQQELFNNPGLARPNQPTATCHMVFLSTATRCA